MVSALAPAPLGRAAAAAAGEEVWPRPVATWAVVLVGALVGAGAGAGSLGANLVSAAVQAAGLVAADSAFSGSRGAPRTELWQRASASGSPAALAAGLAALATAEPEAARAAAKAAAGALAATGVAKLAVGRARPDEGEGPHAFGSFARSVGSGRPPWRDGWMSMPSGHAAASFAVAHSLARRWPQAAPLLYGWAISVGLSRIPLQEHWPSDTWVGARLGLAVATFP